MTTPATHAFAPSFAHTSAAPDVTLTFAAGVSPVTASLATGTYRMWLASSASCYARALAQAVKAAISLARGTAPTVTATLSAAGIVSLTFATDVPATITFAAPVWRILGLSSATPTITAGVVTGALPVMYLALLSAATGPFWQPKQSGGAEQAAGGRVYVFASSVTSWERALRVHFQPTTPTLRIAHGCEATAMYPAEIYFDALGSTATAREWSVLDVLYAARNALCGYTGTWSTARTSTVERIWRVYVAPRTLLSPTTELLKAEWMAFCEWELAIVAPSTTPTETRG